MYSLKCNLFDSAIKYCDDVVDTIKPKKRIKFGKFFSFLEVKTWDWHKSNVNLRAKEAKKNNLSEKEKGARIARYAKAIKNAAEFIHNMPKKANAISKLLGPNEKEMFMINHVCEHIKLYKATDYNQDITFPGEKFYYPKQEEKKTVKKVKQKDVVKERDDFLDMVAKNMQKECSSLDTILNKFNENSPLPFQKYNNVINTNKEDYEEIGSDIDSSDDESKCNCCSMIYKS